MKKVISLLLVTILAINFVFSSFTMRISSSTDDKMVIVDVIWDDISFTYDVGTSSWNPSNHSYESDGNEASWTDKSGKITAYNYSDMPISIDMTFEPTEAPNGTAVLNSAIPRLCLERALA